MYSSLSFPFLSYPRPFDLASVPFGLAQTVGISFTLYGSPFVSTCQIITSSLRANAIRAFSGPRRAASRR